MESSRIKRALGNDSTAFINFIGDHKTNFDFTHAFLHPPCIFFAHASTLPASTISNARSSLQVTLKLRLLAMQLLLIRLSNLEETLPDWRSKSVSSNMAPLLGCLPREIPSIMSYLQVCVSKKPIIYIYGNRLPKSRVTWYRVTVAKSHQRDRAQPHRHTTSFNENPKLFNLSTTIFHNGTYNLVSLFFYPLDKSISGSA